MRTATKIRPLLRFSDEAGARTLSSASSIRAPAERTGTGAEGSVTANVRRWAGTCFSARDPASEQEIKALIHEASEVARDDYGVDSANELAGGYRSPEEYVNSDVKFLQSQMLDFASMVQRRLQSLAPDRLNNERVEGLRPDNLERTQLFALVGGMKVHRPEGFVPNGSLRRTDLRSAHEAVAPAVNKMLGEQKLAFLLPLRTAQQSYNCARRTGARRKAKRQGAHWETSAIFTERR
jgi:hypothetical protein